MRVLVSGPDKERRKKGESSEIKEKVVDGSFLFPLRSASAPSKEMNKGLSLHFGVAYDFD